MEVMHDHKNGGAVYSNLVHALSGMAGGIVAISTFYPLNIIRLKLQIDEKLKSQSVLSVANIILREEGIEGLYKGWWSSIVSLGASNFVYFYSYNALKAMYLNSWTKKDTKSIDPITNLIIATVAGVMNVLITTPLWVAGIRLSLQSSASKSDNGEVPYKGIFDCLVRITKDEEFLALWKGVGPSLILVSNPSIQFVTYERLRAPLSKLAEKRGKRINAIEFFLIGAVAKTVATVFTYPIQLAQSRLRADKGKDENCLERNYKSTLDVIHKVYVAHGFKGLFKGMEAKLWQTVLTAAFQFLTYEQMRRVAISILHLKQSSHD